VSRDSVNLLVVAVAVCAGWFVRVVWTAWPDGQPVVNLLALVVTVAMFRLLAWNMDRG
jgi:hypothetical protein